MDNLPIPDSYYEKIFSDLPLEEWRDFFQKNTQFKDSLKGFRAHKIPQKILRLQVIKLLRDHIEFRKTALEFWALHREEKVSLKIYAPEHLDENLDRYCGFFGSPAFFWLCLLDSRTEMQGLAQKVLQREGKSESRETGSESDLNQIHRLEEKMSAHLQKTMEEKFGALEKKMKSLSNAQLYMEEEQTLLKDKLQSKSDQIMELQREKNGLAEELQAGKREIEQLRKEGDRLQKSLPSDFIPCSIVAKLQKKMGELEHNLGKIQELRYEVEAQKARGEKQKRTHAETLQKLRKAREKNREFQEKLEAYERLNREKIQATQKKKPDKESVADPSKKVIWPSDAHHYPKRLANFLEKLSKLVYVEEINIIEFENSVHSRVKSIDSQGNILLLFSDGQVAAKVFVKTTAVNYEEGLYVEGCLLKLDSFLTK